MAVLADPAGAVFCVWQPGEHRGAQVVNEPGAWAMSALLTPDPEGVKDFYGAVFGWESDSFDAGELRGHAVPPARLRGRRARAARAARPGGHDGAPAAATRCRPTGAWTSGSTT